MQLTWLLALRDQDVKLFAIVVFATGIFLFLLFLFGIWREIRLVATCPYTKTPLRPLTDLPVSTMEKVLRFLYDFHDVDNPLIKIRKAVYSRETGRIYANAITIFGTMDVDWSFINKRAAGHYVSWGSLSEEKKMAVIDCHDSLVGFQTEVSCPISDPSLITKEYVYTMPGPLYVDLKTKVLLGWMVVPGTMLEVLVVQKPTKSGRYRI